MTGGYLPGLHLKYPQISSLQQKHFHIFFAVSFIFYTTNFLNCKLKQKQTFTYICRNRKSRIYKHLQHSFQNPVINMKKLNQPQTDYHGRLHMFSCFQQTTIEFSNTLFSKIVYIFIGFNNQILNSKITPMLN